MIKTRQLFPKTLEELENDIEGLQFFCVDDGLLTEGRHTTYYHNNEIRSIHIDTLRSIDPRLPLLVSGLIAKVREVMDRPDINEFFGGTFRDTLRLWTNPRVAKTVELGDFVYRQFEHIDFIGRNGDTIVARVLVKKCEIVTIKGADNDKLDIVTSTSNLLCDLDPAWLDMKFPGWMQRYEVADTLGTEGRALIDYVFPHQFSFSIELPLVDDISFE